MSRKRVLDSDLEESLREVGVDSDEESSMTPAVLHECGDYHNGTEREAECGSSQQLTTTGSSLKSRKWGKSASEGSCWHPTMEVHYKCASRRRQCVAQCCTPRGTQGV